MEGLRGTGSSSEIQTPITELLVHSFRQHPAPGDAQGMGTLYTCSPYKLHVTLHDLTVNSMYYSI